MNRAGEDGARQKQGRRVVNGSIMRANGKAVSGPKTVLCLLADYLKRNKRLKTTEFQFHAETIRLRGSNITE